MAFQSRLLRASPPRCSMSKKRGRKGGARALLVWLCLESVLSFSGQRVLDRRDQWGSLVLTLSNSTRCILTAALSPYHVSHSPVARHRNQIHHKERPPRICPERVSFSSKISKPAGPAGRCHVNLIYTSILIRYITVLPCCRNFCLSYFVKRQYNSIK